MADQDATRAHGPLNWTAPGFMERIGGLEGEEAAQYRKDYNR